MMIEVYGQNKSLLNWKYAPPHHKHQRRCYISKQTPCLCTTGSDILIGKGWVHMKAAGKMLVWQR